tara:strand:- start:374 stop:508 length:135 start_codon:yes stop_codon:yes gene_type:complete
MTNKEDQQKSMIPYLEGVGHKVIVGKGAADASKQVLEHCRDKNS